MCVSIQNREDVITSCQRLVAIFREADKKFDIAIEISAGENPQVELIDKGIYGEILGYKRGHSTPILVFHYYAESSDLELNLKQRLSNYPWFDIDLEKHKKYSRFDQMRESLLQLATLVACLSMQYLLTTQLN